MYKNRMKIYNIHKFQPQTSQIKLDLYISQPNTAQVLLTQVRKFSTTQSNLLQHDTRNLTSYGGITVAEMIYSVAAYVLEEWVCRIFEYF